MEKIILFDIYAISLLIKNRVENKLPHALFP